MAVGEIPRILWFTAFARQLDLGYPLDNVIAHSNPKPGSEFADAPSGEADSYIIGFDQILEADIRWIPTADTTNPVATGWDTATLGFRLFLEYAREKQDIRFIPDKDTPATFIDCILVGPMERGIRKEKDGIRRIRMVLRSKDGTAFTGY